MPHPTGSNLAITDSAAVKRLLALGKAGPIRCSVHRDSRGLSPAVGSSSSTPSASFLCRWPLSVTKSSLRRAILTVTSEVGSRYRLMSELSRRAPSVSGEEAQAPQNRASAKETCSQVGRRNAAAESALWVESTATLGSANRIDITRVST